MQQVHQGVTQSGRHGLFTGHCLAWGFTEDSPVVKRWNAMTHTERVEFCKRINFELVGETSNVGF